MLNNTDKILKYCISATFGFTQFQYFNKNLPTIFIYLQLTRTACVIWKETFKENNMCTLERSLILASVGLQILRKLNFITSLSFR